MFTCEMVTIIKLVAVTNILVAFCFLNNKILSDIYVTGLKHSWRHLLTITFYFATFSIWFQVLMLLKDRSKPFLLLYES